MRGRDKVRRTKDDLAAVQYTDELIAWCLVVIDLEQL